MKTVTKRTAGLWKMSLCRSCNMLLSGFLINQTQTYKTLKTFSFCLWTNSPHFISGLTDSGFSLNWAQVPSCVSERDSSWRRGLFFKSHLRTVQSVGEDSEDGDVCVEQLWASTYRAGDDTHILGILFEPVVHVLTHSEKVVETGSLARGPVTLRDLERGWLRQRAMLATALQHLRSRLLAWCVICWRNKHTGAILAVWAPQLEGGAGLSAPVRQMPPVQTTEWQMSTIDELLSIGFSDSFLWVLTVKLETIFSICTVFTKGACNIRRSSSGPVSIMEWNNVTPWWQIIHYFFISLLLSWCRIHKWRGMKVLMCVCPR